MNEKMKEIFANCFKALENFTEEDIVEFQALYNKEVGRYDGVIPSKEFEPIYPIIEL